MKKRIKIIMIIVVSIVLLGIIFRIVDHNRVMYGKTPIFAIYFGKNKDTNAHLYYGLGYIAVRCIDNGKEYTNIELIGGENSKHVCFSGE